MNTKLHFLIAAIVSVLICQPNAMLAQNLGFEIGTAGVENFDAGILNWGFSINLPITDKVSYDISYNSWQGADGNYDYAQDNFSDDWMHRPFYGNSGLNLMLLYKVYGTNKFSISLGSGFGRYEMKEFYNNSYDLKYYHELAFSVSSLIKYNISEHLGIYGKTIISIKSFDAAPGWGIFNLGIELSPFK
jgi:hypothetical protein